VGTQVFVKVPARQHEEEAFACGRRHLTTWAKEEGGPERVELSLSLVCGRAVSIDSLASRYARRSSLWR
jgi:hypothetical protein